MRGYVIDIDDGTRRAQPLMRHKCVWTRLFTLLTAALGMHKSMEELHSSVYIHMENSPMGGLASKMGNLHIFWQYMYLIETLIWYKSNKPIFFFSFNYERLTNFILTLIAIRT
jgi:hypothetical protein